MQLLSIYLFLQQSLQPLPPLAKVPTNIIANKKQTATFVINNFVKPIC